jgi:sugar/nucleoside kinase (ribokinase family)
MNMTPYEYITGTGGIGSGVVYKLLGDHDLGRNETRFGHRSEQRDFCKLHIVFHYIAVLLAELQPSIEVYPIGAVGDDDEGKGLVRLMRSAGLKCDYLKTTRDSPTLKSVCYQFPDGSGGNITESESASSKVGPSDIDQAQPFLSQRKTISIALPEVPLNTRLHLIERSKAEGTFTAASFISEELQHIDIQWIAEKTDLLALNIDEAVTLAQVSGHTNAAEDSPLAATELCYQTLSVFNSEMRLVVTAGSDGAYAAHKGKVHKLPALKLAAVNTAGAGDAFLAGVIIGHVLGYDFISDSPLSAFRFGRNLSAFSVLSKDTINFDISIESFDYFLREHGEIEMADSLKNIYTEYD